MKYSIVLTCLKPPTKLLLDYAKNFRLYQHEAHSNEVNFIIIGDKKTDNMNCRILSEELYEQGFVSHYLSIDDQKKIFPKKLLDIIPFHSDNRRNLGYFYAKMLGAKNIISLDDDNFVSGQSDFLKNHSLDKKNLVCHYNKDSRIKWFNICKMLQFNLNTEIFARGHPLNYREQCFNSTKSKTKSIKPIVNLGLWESSPDVDAFLNIAHPQLRSYGLKTESIGLGPRVWCPINSQNTCIDAKAIPAYYFIKQKFNGLIIDRYGDIWQGYFLKKCIDTLGDYITVGEPVANHLRNQHNYLRDLEKELLGMKITPFLIDWLEAINLEGKTYEDCYVSLANKLEEWKLPFMGKLSLDKMKKQIAQNMRVWVECQEKTI